MTVRWRPAPAALALLDQATKRSPKRSTKSDGLLGDPAHAARKSFHNPDSRGVVLAVDLTHDPAHGIDAHLLAHDAVARRDPRVLEAISQRRIWTKARAAEGWRSYGGENPHDKHCHISIDRKHENDTSPWWPAFTTSRPGKTITDRMEDEMAELSKEQEDRIVSRIVGAIAPSLTGGKDLDPGHVSTADLFRLVARVEKKLDDMDPK